MDTLAFIAALLFVYSYILGAGQSQNIEEDSAMLEIDDKQQLFRFYSTKQIGTKQKKTASVKNSITNPIGMCIYFIYSVCKMRVTISKIDN